MMEAAEPWDWYWQEGFSQHAHWADTYEGAYPYAADIEAQSTGYMLNPHAAPFQMPAAFHFNAAAPAFEPPRQAEATAADVLAGAAPSPSAAQSATASSSPLLRPELEPPGLKGRPCPAPLWALDLPMSSLATTPASTVQGLATPAADSQLPPSLATEPLPTTAAAAALAFLRRSAATSVEAQAALASLGAPAKQLLGSPPSLATLTTGADSASTGRSRTSSASAQVSLPESPVISHALSPFHVTQEALAAAPQLNLAPSAAAQGPGAQHRATGLDMASRRPWGAGLRTPQELEAWPEKWQI